MTVLNIDLSASEEEIKEEFSLASTLYLNIMAVIILDICMERIRRELNK